MQAKNIGWPQLNCEIVCVPVCAVLVTSYANTVRQLLKLAIFKDFGGIIYDMKNLCGHKNTTPACYRIYSKVAA